MARGKRRKRDRAPDDPEVRRALMVRLVRVLFRARQHLSHKLAAEYYARNPQPRWEPNRPPWADWTWKLGRTRYYSTRYGPPPPGMHGAPPEPPGVPPPTPPPKNEPPTRLQLFLRELRDTFWIGLIASVLTPPPEKPAATAQIKPTADEPPSEAPRDDAEQRVNDEAKARNRRAFQRSEKMAETVRRQQYEKLHGQGYSRPDGSWVSMRDDPPPGMYGARPDPPKQPQADPDLLSRWETQYKFRRGALIVAVPLIAASTMILWPNVITRIVCAVSTIVAALILVSALGDRHAWPKPLKPAGVRNALAALISIGGALLIVAALGPLFQKPVAPPPPDAAKTERAAIPVAQRPADTSPPHHAAKRASVKIATAPKRPPIMQPSAAPIVAAQPQAPAPATPTVARAIPTSGAMRPSTVSQAAQQKSCVSTRVQVVIDIEGTVNSDPAAAFIRVTNDSDSPITHFRFWSTLNPSVPYLGDINGPAFLNDELSFTAHKARGGTFSAVFFSRATMPPGLLAHEVYFYFFYETQDGLLGEGEQAFMWYQDPPHFGEESVDSVPGRHDIIRVARLAHNYDEFRRRLCGSKATK